MRVALLVLLLLGGCNAVKGTVPRTAVDLEGSPWNLVSMRGEPLSGGSDITLEVEDDRLGGYGGCNWYGATYTANDESFNLGTIERTQRACADEAIGAREEAYFRALNEVEAYELGEATLILKDDRGVNLLEYVRKPRFDMDPEDLIGTSWHLQTDGAPTSAATIIFARETLSGFGGCRGYSGTWTAEGDELHVSSISMDQTTCDSEELLEIEQQYTTDLSESRQYRLSGDRLELFTDSGRTLRFVAAD